MRIHEQLINKKIALENVQNHCADMLEYLESPKFTTGDDNIRVWEVKELIRRIKDVIWEQESH
jgi:hypothetical protein